MDIVRKGVSSLAVVAVLVLVIVVAGGVYFLLPPRGGGTTSTSVSSTVPTSTSSGSSSSARVIMEMQPSAPLASSDVVANYTAQVSIIGTETAALSLGAESPAGVAVGFSQTQIQPGSSSTVVSVSLRVDASVAPGAYPFNVTLSGDGQEFSQEFHVEVVKYLVVTVGAAFVPANMTVPEGSTVYWMRLNGAIDQYDNGDHNVFFRSISATSPTLAQYQSYSYTFAQAGTYEYYCTFHPAMTAEILVT